MEDREDGWEAPERSEEAGPETRSGRPLEEAHILLGFCLPWRAKAYLDVAGAIIEEFGLWGTVAVARKRYRFAGRTAPLEEYRVRIEQGSRAYEGFGLRFRWGRRDRSTLQFYFKEPARLE